MTTNNSATDDAMYSPDTQKGGRLGSFTANGALVVYDRDNPNAWIQSDLAVTWTEAQ